MILCISAVSVVTSPFSFLILLIWVTPLFFLMSLANSLSILFTSSKDQLFVLFVFAIVSFFSFLFFFILQVLISHQFYTHQCIHINPNHPIQHTTIPTPPQFSPLGVHMSVLYICVSTSEEGPHSWRELPGSWKSEFRIQPHLSLETCEAKNRIFSEVPCLVWFRHSCPILEIKERGDKETLCFSSCVFYWSRLVWTVLCWYQLLWQTVLR